MCDRESFIFLPDDVLIAISQSGETYDTLQAVKLTKPYNIFCIALINTIGSSIALWTDTVAYLNVGPEIAVASTKAFLDSYLCFYYSLFISVAIKE